MLQVIWNFGMIILFLVFVYHMLKGTSDVSRFWELTDSEQTKNNYIYRNILDNLKALRSNPDEYHFRSRESVTSENDYTTCEYLYFKIFQLQSWSHWV